MGGESARLPVVAPEVRFGRRTGGAARFCLSSNLKVISYHVATSSVAAEAGAVGEFKPGRMVKGTLKGGYGFLVPWVCQILV